MFDVFLRFMKNLRLKGMEYFGRYYSSYRGFVVSNEDKGNQRRVQVLVPAVDPSNPLPDWAYPKEAWAGRGRNARGVVHNYGIDWVPSPGDPVHVEFEHGDTRFPIYSGGWWKNPLFKPGTSKLPSEFKAGINPATLLPVAPTTRGIVTKAGHKIIFEDGFSSDHLEQRPRPDDPLKQEEMKLLIESAFGHKIRLSDENNQLVIESIDDTIGSGPTAEYGPLKIILDSEWEPLPTIPAPPYVVDPAETDSPAILKAVTQAAPTLPTQWAGDPPSPARLAKRIRFETPKGNKIRIEDRAGGVARSRIILETGGGVEETPRRIELDDLDQSITIKTGTDQEIKLMDNGPVGMTVTLPAKSRVEFVGIDDIHEVIGRYVLSAAEILMTSTGPTTVNSVGPLIENLTGERTTNVNGIYTIIGQILMNVLSSTYVQNFGVLGASVASQGSSMLGKSVAPISLATLIGSLGTPKGAMLGDLDNPVFFRLVDERFIRDVFNEHKHDPDTGELIKGQVRVDTQQVTQVGYKVRFSATEAVGNKRIDEVATTETVGN